MHTTQRITSGYVAASLLAYVAFLLSVLVADLHHRGRMPYQRRGSGGATAAKAARPPPRPAPFSPRITALPGAATAASPQPPAPHANVFFDDTHFSGTLPVQPPPHEPFQPTLLPLSATPVADNASDSHGHADGSIARAPGSIQYTADRSTRAARGPAGGTRGLLKPLLNTPPRVLQLLQFATIPQRPEDAGVAWLLSGVHCSIVLRLTLAAAVVMVYFRGRLSHETCLAFAGGWAAAVAVFAGVWWLVSDPAPEVSGGEGGYGGTYGSTGAPCIADIQMQELELRRDRPGVLRGGTDVFTDIELGTGGDFETAGVVYGARPGRGANGRAGAVGESTIGAGLRGGIARLYGRDDAPAASYPPLPPTFDEIDIDDLALSEIGFVGPVGGVREGSAATDGVGGGGPSLPAAMEAVPPEPAASPLRRGVALVLAAVLSLAAFGAAVLWVQLVAEELVAVLGLVGAILRLDHTLIGATLLAWGVLLLFLLIVFESRMSLLSARRQITFV